MGEFVSVRCDTPDCYTVAYDIVGAMFAHERNFDGGPEFVTANRWVSGHREWLTWCRGCAAEMNLDRFRRGGWTITVPPGFEEGVACGACSYELDIPLGYPNNGEPRSIYDENNRFVGQNPKFLSWQCEECKGTGWLRAQINRGGE